MVRKLIKHELRDLLRVLVFVWIGAFAAAAIGRIVTEAAPDSIAGVLFYSMAYTIASIAFFFGFLASVGRFSRSLFTPEGYMTFSVPASATQLIVAKLLSTLVLTLMGAVVALLCAVVALAGLRQINWTEIFSLLSAFLGTIGAYLSSDPLLIVEIVLEAIAALPATLLYFYLVISVGQLFNKGRVGFTFAIAIGGLVLFSLLDSFAIEPLFALMAEQGLLHLAAWIEIVLTFAMDFGAFFLTRYLLTDKLNLMV